MFFFSEIFDGFKAWISVGTRSENENLFRIWLIPTVKNGKHFNLNGSVSTFGIFAKDLNNKNAVEFES